MQSVSFYYYFGRTVQLHRKAVLWLRHFMLRRCHAMAFLPGCHMRPDMVPLLPGIGNRSVEILRDNIFEDSQPQ